MNANANRLQLTFANRADEAPHISNKIEIFLEQQQIDPSIINKILLCVDELITNIIAHAYTDHEEHAVSLECSVMEDRISLELRDDGIPFDPTEKNKPTVLLKTIEDTPIGGLGIHLVMTLMDHVEYEREGDYNVLRATKMIA
jgi:anti-sigma regulatory factor (Ser/Thr protein kinase)